MPKKKKGFEAAQEILNRPKEPARVFSSTLPKEGVLPSDPRLTQKFQVDGRQVSREELKAEVARRKGEIPPEGAKIVMSPEELARRQEFLKATGSEIIPSQPEQTQPQQIPTQEPKRDIGSALVAGLGEAAITGAAGAGTGAAAGLFGGPAAPVTVPVAAAIVGVPAAVAGFIHGFTSKLKKDAEENIQAEYDTLPGNAKNVRLLVISAKIDPERSYKAFWMQLNAIDKAYSDTKLESQRSLNAFLKVDTTVEMAAFERFYAPGGIREIYINRMNQVILNPRTDVSDLMYPSDLEEQ